MRPARGWYKQHNWVTAYFGADDDVLAEDFHLPGARPCELRAPEDSGFAVLDGAEGEPLSNRHGAELAEALAERSRAAP